MHRHAVLATEPATQMQVGAIHGQFRRLGYGHADRDRRLAACAALLGLDALDTTTTLTMGDAGRAVRILQSFADRAEMDAALREHQDAGRPATFADLLTAIIRTWTGTKARPIISP